MIFKVLDNISCDGKKYVAGDTIQPRTELIPQLEQAGVIEPIEPNVSEKKNSPKTVETGKEDASEGSQKEPSKPPRSRKSTAKSKED
jgi:hypothetical protein